MSTASQSPAGALTQSGCKGERHASLKPLSDPSRRCSSRHLGFQRHRGRGAARRRRSRPEPPREAGAARADRDRPHRCRPGAALRPGFRPFLLDQASPGLPALWPERVSVFLFLPFRNKVHPVWTVRARHAVSRSSAKHRRQGDATAKEPRKDFRRLRQGNSRPKDGLSGMTSQETQSGRKNNPSVRPTRPIQRRNTRAHRSSGDHLCRRHPVPARRRSISAVTRRPSSGLCRRTRDVQMVGRADLERPQGPHVMPLAASMAAAISCAVIGPSAALSTSRALGFAAMTPAARFFKICRFGRGGTIQPFGPVLFGGPELSSPHGGRGVARGPPVRRSRFAGALFNQPGPRTFLLK
jgi:hypothetical protein